MIDRNRIRMPLARLDGRAGGRGCLCSARQPARLTTHVTGRAENLGPGQTWVEQKFFSNSNSNKIIFQFRTRTRTRTKTSNFSNSNVELEHL